MASGGLAQLEDQSMAVLLASSLITLPFLKLHTLLPLSATTSTVLPLIDITPVEISLTSLSSSSNPRRTPLWTYHQTSSHRYYPGGDFIEDGDDSVDFEEAVALFNSRDYYSCHDYLEALWNKSQEPTRTLIHGILQCAVGFHHLFNQNHRGAMMELGEGLCKLRKMNFDSGPFHQFEKDISAVLDFIYHTQLELAACTDDFCLALDQSERSYQLLGGYAAGQRLYFLEGDPNQIVYIVFCPERSYGASEQPRVKLPILHASEEHLTDFEHN